MAITAVSAADNATSDIVSVETTDDVVNVENANEFVVTSGDNEISAANNTEVVVDVATNIIKITNFK